jgi:hypothetical protein
LARGGHVGARDRPRGGGEHLEHQDVAAFGAVQGEARQRLGPFAPRVRPRPSPRRSDSPACAKRPASRLHCRATRRVRAASHR